jgi:hypothetical protein
MHQLARSVICAVTECKRVTKVRPRTYLNLQIM